MKKVNLLIIVLIICTLLTGCGNKTADVSDNSVLIQFGETKITKSDLYKSMLESDAGATVINLVQKYILDAEIETTDEITAEADERMAQIKEEMDGT